MFRRLFWMSLGLGAGAAGAVMASRWMRRQADRVAPANLVREAGRGLMGLGGELAERLGEFRAGMAEREAELRAELGEE